MRVIFAGGGTGGHINPAISVADYAKRNDKDFEALFIGTKNGLETKLVPKAGYDIEYVDIEGFDRSHLLRNVSVVKKLIKARSDMKKIIKRFKPDCIICTGGYVSGPVTMAAKAMKIPSLIHEQNVYPGMTVRGSEKYVDYLAVSFDETVNLMNNNKKCVVTGNPIRSEILEASREEARSKMGISKPFVLIFGGSLGADKINNTVLDMIERISDEGKIEVMFATGDRNYDKIIERTKNMNLYDNIKILPYIDNMAQCMAAADIVVSRAGAITVSEIAALGKPSVLIPSPNVVRNHQEQNAREFEKSDAAELILEKDLSGQLLYDKIMKLAYDNDRLEKMSENLKKLAKTDALEKIYGLMLKMSKKSNRGRMEGKEMHKIREAVIVEGTYDKIRLSQLVDTLIIKTDGFSVFKNKPLMTMIRRIAKERGIVIFTDSDSAGFQIRNFIKQNIPKEYVKHAYIPDVYGKERRKRYPGKEGLIGVEGIDNSVLLDALKKAGCEFEDGEEKEKKKEITKVNMFKLGFSGGVDSKARRDKLLSDLKLPSKMSSNMLLEVLNDLFTYEEFCDFLKRNDYI